MIRARSTVEASVANHSHGLAGNESSWERILVLITKVPGNEAGPQWLSGIDHWISHSTCWPDGQRALASLGSNPGLGELNLTSGHAMRLNSRTGIEGLPVYSLNCDRPLHSGLNLKAPELVMDAGSRDNRWPPLCARDHHAVVLSCSYLARRWAALGHHSALVNCRCTSKGVLEKPTLLAGHLKRTDTMPFK